MSKFILSSMYRVIVHCSVAYGLSAYNYNYMPTWYTSFKNPKNLIELRCNCCWVVVLFGSPAFLFKITFRNYLFFLVPLPSFLNRKVQDNFQELLIFFIQDNYLFISCFNNLVPCRLFIPFIHHLRLSDKVRFTIKFGIHNYLINFNI